MSDFATVNVALGTCCLAGTAMVRHFYNYWHCNLYVSNYKRSSIHQDDVLLLEAENTCIKTTYRSVGHIDIDLAVFIYRHTPRACMVVRDKRQ